MLRKTVMNVWDCSDVGRDSVHRTKRLGRLVVAKAGNISIPEEKKAGIYGLQNYDSDYLPAVTRVALHSLFAPLFLF